MKLFFLNYHLKLRTNTSMFIKTLLICGIATLYFDVPTSANIIVANSYSSSAIVLHKSVDVKNDNLHVQAEIPYIPSVQFDNLFIDEVNDLINILYETKLAEALESSATHMSFQYSQRTNGNILSIIINTTTTISSTASARHDINVFNIDLTNNKLLTINDVLGPNGVSIANKVIFSQIEATPYIYSSRFTGIKNDHTFYIEDDIIVIAFNKFEIASGVMDIVTFRIDPANIINFEVTPSMYYIKDTYNLKMLPLREICEAFGYIVSWVEDTQSIDIKRMNPTEGSFFSSLTLNLNSYFRTTSAKRPLETAPEIVDGITFVPISFFTEILSLTYYVQENGTIVFSDYFSENNS